MPVQTQFCYIKVGFKGVYLSRTCFPNDNRQKCFKVMVSTVIYMYLIVADNLQTMMIHSTEQGISTHREDSAISLRKHVHAIYRDFFHL